MRTVLRLFFFGVTLFVVLALVLTFTQDAFKKEAGAHFLFFTTRTFPVYIYILAAFMIGLVLGAMSILGPYLRVRGDRSRAGRRVRELEEKLNEAEKTLAAREAVTALAASKTKGF